jgi:hypothetical protein
MRRYRIAMLLLTALAVSGATCSDSTAPQEPALQITLGNISLNCPASSSFAKTCTGTVRLNFSRAPQSGTSYFVVLNASDINGTGSATGATTVDVNLSGQTFSCPFTNPSNLIVYRGTSAGGASDASINFNWTSGTLCSGW